MTDRSAVGAREVTAEPMMREVTVYTKPACPQCVATKRWLDKQGVAYRSVDITTDPDARAEVMSLGYSSAPVVVAGGDHWSGFKPDRLKGLVSGVAAA